MVTRARTVESDAPKEGSLFALIPGPGPMPELVLITTGTNPSMCNEPIRHNARTTCLEGRGLNGSGVTAHKGASVIWVKETPSPGLPLMVRAYPMPIDTSFLK